MKLFHHHSSNVSLRSELVATEIFSQMDNTTAGIETFSRMCWNCLRVTLWFNSGLACAQNPLGYDSKKTSFCLKYPIVLSQTRLQHYITLKILDRRSAAVWSSCHTISRTTDIICDTCITHMNKSEVFILATWLHRLGLWGWSNLFCTFKLTCFMFLSHIKHDTKVGKPKKYSELAL